LLFINEVTAGVQVAENDCVSIEQSLRCVAYRVPKRLLLCKGLGSAVAPIQIHSHKLKPIISHRKVLPSMWELRGTGFDLGMDM
jgi:hypothetical protein